VDPVLEARVAAVEALVLDQDPVEELVVVRVVEHRVLEERERDAIGDPEVAEQVVPSVQ
jgi:hypothetical protein